MLLQITTTHKPATDLGFLLHKNPSRVHTKSLSAGRAIIFYPEVSEDRCTAALLVELNSVDLVRGKVGAKDSPYPLDQYVNDRPYACSSFMSVAISRVFSSALQGTSKEREELANTKIPFEVNISSLPCRGGEQFLKELFEPLGYEVDASRLSLDENFPEWGESPYYTVTLKCKSTLKSLLTHLNVLIPVLDNKKHYWVGDEEVDKLLRRGEGWLGDHPMVNEITSRYLKHRRSLARMALEQLVREEEPELELTDERGQQNEEEIEEKISLNEARIKTVTNMIKDADVESVVDLGCGEGKLLKSLMRIRSLSSITGMDVSLRTLEYAEKRLDFNQLPAKQKERINLIHGSLIYRDKRIEKFEAATVVEVIEHMDLNRLSAFERVLFEFARPKLIIITTPNSEYNTKFESLPAGKFRHSDHRFEWTRGEFSGWSLGVADKYGYSVEFKPIGPLDEALGAPTQMGVFKLCK